MLVLLFFLSGTVPAANDSTLPEIGFRAIEKPKAKRVADEGPIADVKLECYQEGKFFGLKDDKGVVVLPAMYESEIRFIDSLNLNYDRHVARIKRNGLWGFVTSDCRILLAPAYQDCDYFSSNGLAAVKINGKWGYIDKTGSVVIPTSFANCSGFSHGLAPAFDGDRWGYITVTGEWSIRPRFVWANLFHEERASVKVGDSWGFIDTSGRCVVPPTYRSVTRFMNGTAEVTKMVRVKTTYGPKLTLFHNEVYVGVIDLEGNLLKPFAPYND